MVRSTNFVLQHLSPARISVMQNFVDLIQSLKLELVG